MLSKSLLFPQLGHARPLTMESQTLHRVLGISVSPGAYLGAAQKQVTPSPIGLGLGLDKRVPLLLRSYLVVLEPMLIDLASVAISVPNSPPVESKKAWASL